MKPYIPSGLVPATQWGLIPPVLDILTQTLKDKIAAACARLNETHFPDNPADVEQAMARTVRHTHEINAASRDLRAALSAYAHKIHQPRPRITTIATAQEASPQGLVRRYSESTEQALRALIRGTTTAEQLLAAFPTLTEPEAAAIVQTEDGARPT